MSFFITECSSKSNRGVHVIMCHDQPCVSSEFMLTAHWNMITLYSWFATLH